MITQVSVNFNLEHLRPLEVASIKDAIIEKLESEDSDNFFEDNEFYAIFDPASVQVSLSDEHSSNL